MRLVCGAEEGLEAVDAYTSDPAFMETTLSDRHCLHLTASDTRFLSSDFCVTTYIDAFH